MIRTLALALALFSVATLPAARAAAPATAQSVPATVNISRSHGPSSSPAAAIDPAGQLHVAWADHPEADDPSVQYVFYARSTDGGHSFEQPRRISVGSDDGLRAKQIRVSIGPTSEVTVAWWASVPADNGNSFLTAFVVRSNDGGESFAPAQPTTLRFREGITADEEGFANTTSLSLGSGPDGQSYLLATVQDYYHGFNVYFARSSDGVTFSDPLRVSNYSLTLPRAATNALYVSATGQLYATWTEGHGDFIDEIKDIFFVASTDGGRSFSQPLQVSHASGVVAAVLKIGKSTALLAQLQRTPRSKAVFKLYRSSDGGRSYGARAIVAVVSYSHPNQNSIALDASGTVAIAWSDNSSLPGPPNGIYVAVSHDGGHTFGAPRLAAEGNFPEPPAVTVDPSGHVGLVFTSLETNLADREILFLSLE